MELSYGINLAQLIVSGRGISLAISPKSSPDAFVFLNVLGAPMTRFGIHALVERTVAINRGQPGTPKT